MCRSHNVSLVQSVSKPMLARRDGQQMGTEADMIRYPLHDAERTSDTQPGTTLSRLSRLDARSTSIPLATITGLSPPPTLSTSPNRLSTSCQAHHSFAQHPTTPSHDSLLHTHSHSHAASGPQTNNLPHPPTHLFVSLHLHTGRQQRHIRTGSPTYWLLT